MNARRLTRSPRVALPTPCVGRMAPPARVNLVLTFGGGNTVRSTQMMKGETFAALLACMLGLAGCAGPGQVLFDNSIVVDHLDGNYQRLASCTYEHLTQ